GRGEPHGRAPGGGDDHSPGGAMQPKPFPAEKREYIVNKKSFEEFWDFFQELTPPKKTHLSSSQMLPQPHGGFRPHTRELLRRQLRILWDDARKPENIQSSS